MSDPATLSAAPALDLDRVRACFPALDQPTIFFENAGGSQVPRVVADAMRDYMLSTYVQLNAPYEVSRRSTAVVNDAHAFINTIMNGHGIGHTILSSSSTTLCYMLADAYGRILAPGDEVVVADTAHEANRGPWLRLADRGIVLKHWHADPATGACTMDALDAVLTDRTRIVAFPQVSNLLGEIVDVPAITARVHAAGAKVVVDGVAYAPHRPIDVAAWGVDWYVYSTYKVYGPHMGALFGRDEAIDELPRPNHAFLPRDMVPYAFELGGANHEGCAGLLALGRYLSIVTGRDESAPADRATVVDAFERMGAAELPLQSRLMSYLSSRDDVRIVGPGHGEASRVATMSFRHATRSSRSIAESVCARGVAIRFGHMYAYALCRRMGIDTSDGVVRVSLAHYNTMDEMDRLIAVLDEVM
ncbi:MAG: cysteine desulfurase-like protein [Phycisphaerales bacterium]|nr:cysteine desulfurase-like protein [Phycisphaerales bacterium]